MLKFTRATGHPHPRLQRIIDNHARLLKAQGRSPPEVLAQLNASAAPTASSPAAIHETRGARVFWMGTAVTHTSSEANDLAQMLAQLDPSVTLCAMKPYEDIINFIARTVDAGKLSRFRPSKEAEARVAVLVEKHKTGRLRPAEREELNDFLRLEHVMRMAKARAHKLAVQA